MHGIEKFYIKLENMDTTTNTKRCAVTTSRLVQYKYESFIILLPPFSGSNTEAKAHLKTLIIIYLNIRYHMAEDFNINCASICSTLSQYIAFNKSYRTETDGSSGLCERLVVF